MKNFIRVLAHLVLIFALASITFLILNVYNPLMGFTSSDYSSAVFLIEYILAALLAVLVFSRAGGKKKSRERENPPKE